MSDNISNFFDDPCFSNQPPSPDNLFSIFDALEGLTEGVEDTTRGSLGFQVTSEVELEAFKAAEVEDEDEHKSKKARRDIDDEEIKLVDVEGGDGSNKMSHISVERNRRKQMNEHLSVLRSLMPCFYVKRGDQASIIGGVVEYISELQQVLQSLEAKKQRKVYSEVLSPKLVSSPRPSPQVLSPRKSPLSPRLNLPISPRTPQPSSPYNNRSRINNLSPSINSPIIELSPTSSTSSLNDCLANELVASLKSPVAEVEVKFSGSNLVLKTVSSKISGQVLKIILALEKLSLEILHINISTIEDTMISSFTIKIGIECQLSAEELAQQIQRTFCSPLIN